MEVLNNAAAPFTASTGAVAGNAQRLVLEVLMSKILRRVLRMQDRSFMYLAAVHGLSLPLIGGFQGAIVPPGRLNDPQMTQLQSAAASVPAVYASEYVVNTSSIGFHVPRPNLRDALVTAAAKVLTRPLISNTITYLPSAVAENFVQAFNVQNQQIRSSRLNRGG
jgi:hypothetical protein